MLFVQGTKEVAVSRATDTLEREVDTLEREALRGWEAVWNFQYSTSEVVEARARI